MLRSTNEYDPKVGNVKPFSVISCETISKFDCNSEAISNIIDPEEIPKQITEKSCNAILHSNNHNSTSEIWSKDPDNSINCANAKRKEKNHKHNVFQNMSTIILFFFVTNIVFWLSLRIQFDL